MRNCFKAVLKLLFSEKYQDVFRILFGRYSTTSYSQEGEDMVLRRLFAHRSNIFYVDVGAHHPIRASNTYYFYKKGSRGINIDAMPNSMKMFNWLRKRDINIEVPISDRPETLTYYAFKGVDSLLNTFSIELGEQRIKDGIPFLYKKDLPTATLENILDTYLPKNQKIDLLSIDVEGLDLQVLRSNNFDKYCPEVIAVEILGSSLDEIAQQPIALFLKQKGYYIFAKTIYAVFFLHKSFDKENVY